MGWWQTDSHQPTQHHAPDPDELHEHDLGLQHDVATQLATVTGSVEEGYVATLNVPI